MDSAWISAERFEALTEFLRVHEPLWRERPFVVRRPSWAVENPGLEGWLLGLEQVQPFEDEPRALQHAAPPELARIVERALALCRVPGLELATPAPDLTPTLAWEMPARKRAQVRAFAAAAAEVVPRDLAVVDWCAGKGYLGRALAGLHGRAVTCVEARADLCRKGADLDRRAGLDVRWITADSSSPKAHALMNHGAVVALHACGALHRDLAQSASQSGAAALVIAPCCYHRMTPRLAREARHDSPRGMLPPPPRRPAYVPMSRAARRLDLQLDQHGLRLPASREVVARPRQVRMRHTEQLYRLGLDRLMQRAAGADLYTPMPPFPARWIRLPFSEFVREVSDQYGLDLATSETDPALQYARDRLARARALGLVRGIFRRALELWLVLDIDLLLQEQGYHTRLLTFCAESVTPRNLLLVATRSSTYPI